VNATILAASDLIHVDPDGKRLRLNVNGVAKYATRTPEKQPLHSTLYLSADEQANAD